MATYDYYALMQQYNGFQDPYVDIVVNDKRINDNKKISINISEIDVEITCGYEASVATFSMQGVYDNIHHIYYFDELKNYLALGSAVIIRIGYGGVIREVFRGFISRVRFVFDANDIPEIEVSVMDVKGIMMANNNSRQLKSETYKEAIDEIFSKQCYNNMQSATIINSVTVDKTPDMSNESGGTGGGTGGGAGGAGEGTKKEATDKSIEMVSESDYEFVVKVAKKLNFEFYSIGGNVYFREAKKIKDPLISIDPGVVVGGLLNYSVEYDITGLVESIEVRGVDVGKNKMINSSAKKLGNKLSFGSKAQALIKGQQKVYIDPTIHSKEEADSRAAYLANDIAYRFGTLNAQFVGIPELTPGYFMEFKGFGQGLDNKFYIKSVRHTMKLDAGFTTTVKAEAASIDGSSEDGGTGR